MSVANPVVETFDGWNRLIYLKQGVASYHPITDVYAEYIYQRQTDESLRKWFPLVSGEGGVAKGNGKRTPRYLVLIGGTMVVPYDETGVIEQTGEMITSDPVLYPNIYYVDLLQNSVKIFIAPAEAEIIEIATGGALTAAQNNKLMSLNTDTVPTAVWSESDRGDKLDSLPSKSDIIVANMLDL